MGRYYHDCMSFDNGIETGRAEAGSRVRGGASAARRRMLERDEMHRKKVERNRARAEWEKLQKEEQKERARLDTWARSTGYYRDYADYLERKKSGRQGYAD